jgi:hypothetical protein
MSKKKLNLKSSRQRIVVPGLKLSRVCPIGTVQAKMDHTDDERTIGVFEFDPPKREIRIRFNAAHPGICAAVLSLDQETLNCYVAEMCLLGVERVRRETGDYPWPHDDWPEFLTVCDFLGRNIRSLPAVARSNSAKKAEEVTRKA